VTKEADTRRRLSHRRLDRAKQHLKSARDLLASEDYGDSVSRSYYAIFQATRALLALEGLDSRKHSGVVSLFNQHFIKPAKLDKQLGIFLKDAWRSREIADYSDLAEFTREQAAARSGCRNVHSGNRDVYQHRAAPFAMTYGPRWQRMRVPSATTRRRWLLL
jgi:uncharacterized protein (UPF0332 family)